MIILYHQSNKVTSILNTLENTFIEVLPISIVGNLLAVAKQFPTRLIVWCHDSQKENLNFGEIATIFHHKKIMASYDPNPSSYLQDRIGFIDDSIFINIQKEVQYATWLMSSCVGGINAEILLHFENAIAKSVSIDYFLNSIAKVGMPLGLFCYSDPALLLNSHSEFYSPKANKFILFKFVKQHFRMRSVLLFIFSLLIYEKRLPLLAILYSCFFSFKKDRKINLENIEIQSSKKILEYGTMDVIIPTIGRKKYLYYVLKDLSIQTVLPKNVIIVEQNLLEDSTTELDYLTTEDWPFAIKHIFTHQAGACNARNIALREVKSEWVFLNDDDNRFSSRLIEDVFDTIKKYGITALTTSYILATEKKEYTIINQSGIFGSGNSFVKSSILPLVSFDMGFEFGYGEDNDFGCQIRKTGNDIIYFPELEIVHLKAPSGGFRIKHAFEWSIDRIAPKPSPTIMLFKLKNFSLQQLLQYKLILFLKTHKFNLLALKSFNKKWERSIYWANYLQHNV